MLGGSPAFRLALLLAAAGMLRADKAAGLDRIVVVGDSITANTYMAKPTSEWTRQLERRLGVIVHTYARPGVEMSSGGFFAPGMDEEAPAIGDLSVGAPLAAIVILLGVNDWAGHASLDDFSSAYTRFLDNLNVEPSTPIVCITPIGHQDEAAPNRSGLTLEEYRQAIRNVCANHIVVEGREMLDWNEGLYSDEAHPSDAGSRRLGKHVAAALRSILRY